MRNKKYFLGGIALPLLMVSFFAIEGAAHEWMAPKHAANTKNPVALVENSVMNGKESYLDNCATCHGDNIEGLEAKLVGLEMSPPNLKTRIGTHSDGDFFWKIQEGRGSMPSFKDDLSDKEIWSIINYIRREAVESSQK
jgi:mono/diheme cytochrome c family protein